MKDICFEEDDEYFLMKNIKNKQTKKCVVPRQKRARGKDNSNCNKVMDDYIMDCEVVMRALASG